MKWLTNEYDRLYRQVKEEGKRIVCYLDCFYGDVNGNTIRDIAIIEFFFQEIRIGVRKDVYTHTDQYRGEDEALRFISMCERTHVQWLDESEDHLKEAALRICNALQQKHRSTFKYLDVANEDKTAVLHHFGISAGASEINTL